MYKIGPSLEPWIVPESDVFKEDVSPLVHVKHSIVQPIFINMIMSSGRPITINLFNFKTPKLIF